MTGAIGLTSGGEITLVGMVIVWGITLLGTLPYLCAFLWSPDGAREDAILEKAFIILCWPAIAVIGLVSLPVLLIIVLLKAIAWTLPAWLPALEGIGALCVHTSKKLKARHHSPVRKAHLGCPSQD